MGRGALEATFIAQLTRIGQTVCLDEIMDEFEFWSPRVINYVKLSKCHLGTLSHISCSTDFKIGQNVLLDEARISINTGHIGS